MATSLRERGVAVLHEAAGLHGHLAGCNAIFMECSVLDGGSGGGGAGGGGGPGLWAPAPGTHGRRRGAHAGLNIGTSHTRMAALGFQMLDLVFSQPPLSVTATGQPGPAVSLSLAVYVRDGPLPRLLLPQGTPCPHPTPRTPAHPRAPRARQPQPRARP